MVAPIVWGGAALIGALAIGSGAGTYTGARKIGEGVGEGLKFALPLAVGATAIYYFMQARK